MSNNWVYDTVYAGFLSGGSPKPLVSILKWSNFGWFWGTPILGHLQLSINVLAVSCSSWELLLFDLPIQNNNYPDNIMQPSEPGHHRLILLSKIDFFPWNWNATKDKHCKPTCVAYILQATSGPTNYCRHPKIDIYSRSTISPTNIDLAK